jgi:hypothetical protein
VIYLGGNDCLLEASDQRGNQNALSEEGASSASNGSARIRGRNGNLCTLGRDPLSLWESKGTEMSCGDSLVGVPDIISCQIAKLLCSRTVPHLKSEADA